MPPLLKNHPGKIGSTKGMHGMHPLHDIGQSVNLACI